MAVTDSFLLAGFYQGGIWRMPLSLAMSSVSGPLFDRQGESLIPYPNPASASITLDALVGVNEIKILDATGREVLSEQIADNRKALNVSSFPAGIYSALLLHANGRKEIYRFTVLH